MIGGIGAGSAMISRVPGARRGGLALAGRLFAQSEASLPAAWLTMRPARGADVTAISAGSSLHEGGAAALRGAGGRLIEAADGRARRAIGAADLIIDGVLGIGGRGGLRDPGAWLAAEAERARGLVVAADLASGIDADTGEAAGAALPADVTITFGIWKPGLLIDPGASHAGVVELVDIGLRQHLGPPDVAAAQAAHIAARLPPPTPASGKYPRRRPR